MVPSTDREEVRLVQGKVGPFAARLDVVDVEDGRTGAAEQAADGAAATVAGENPSADGAPGGCGVERLGHHGSQPDCA